jgi:hypothetical protein
MSKFQSLLDRVSVSDAQDISDIVALLDASGEERRRFLREPMISVAPA